MPLVPPVTTALLPFKEKSDSKILAMVATGLEYLVYGDAWKVVTCELSLPQMRVHKLLPRFRRRTSVTSNPSKT
jgi:hypothetical protein